MRSIAKQRGHAGFPWLLARNSAIQQYGGAHLLGGICEFSPLQIRIDVNNNACILYLQRLKELTTEITAMLIITVHVLPIISNILPVVLLLSGFILVVLGVNKCMGARYSYIGIRNTKGRSPSAKRRSRSINAGIIFSNPTLHTNNEKELTDSLFT